MILTPLPASTSSNAAVNLLSRSRIRNPNRDCDLVSQYQDLDVL